MLKTMSVFEARKNFSELINLTYYNNYEIVVEKMGKPMIKMIKITNPIKKTLSRSEIMDKYAGVWNVDISKEIVKSTKSFRKNFKIIN
ncbi:MAG: hypothetical protein UR29_C0013G0051 [Candidatus Woesebacteria bacterium GW2011_GWC2_33_12]|uniref:Antitoxin n=1 Tax=Candidatus Woesebacteria bacterium GW2011_GWB1_33_22 TaxID=1618566 RepID=A0A0G0CLB0_9BACT|nr:MAG: hypothetical protein UR29_C0013G0051 [Candidatus Woesebacteria bacterium GW2011_GWC2_33_12]KKP41738.1 MAG: hypothetical protein UR33_C0011G0053 [Candidatus Woesebacteria bacterium GW2011_GWA2_33_20]KKP44127.1 MAG: hypothetical protein UR35_C0011G0013 [Candidatus Woesebacteria bacterium GW2011_GWB1_33_22]KKP45786.1 MAG: hypothetical protein UR37_C0014G0013 [Microgenomates group bacterium GW2011_GWC1_33_28]KKP50209.1 MAG: hypothetical protein UR41_C0010G0013 [Candidatus Woesebacteria bact